MDHLNALIQICSLSFWDGKGLSELRVSFGSLVLVNVERFFRHLSDFSPFPICKEEEEYYSIVTEIAEVP